MRGLAPNVNLFRHYRADTAPFAWCFPGGELLLSERIPATTAWIAAADPVDLHAFR